MGRSVASSSGSSSRGELQALEILADGVAVSLEEGDQGSRGFFAGRLAEEEGHVDWLETQLGLIDWAVAQDFGGP